MSSREIYLLFVIKVGEKLLAFFPGEFVLLSSGEYYTLLVCRSNRHLKSFVPSAIHLLSQRCIVSCVSTRMYDVAGVLRM